MLTELWIALATLLLLGVASASLGVVLHLNGSLASVGALIGSSDAVDAWLIVLFLGAVAGAAFIVGMNLVSELLEWTDTADGLVYNPLAGTFFGMAFGLVLWTVGVAIAAPLGMEYLAGQQRPFPYFHHESLAGFMVYSIVIGVGYPVIRWWERDMMVYYGAESSPVTQIDAEYEPTPEDEAVLEVLQDGRDSGAPWGRANQRWLREETDLGKREVESSLRALQNAGWIREIARDCYEFVKDPRTD
ncbi:hypothetical protein [Natrononativus amylolyticus]|uniref:hypothetical protein n=1 Tax=Natrononativus amylolyticus TaxID=2963434 RepID=UPI0020CF3BD5|nr:hypothetical protein [Natrononativus amylolyticus]